MCGLAVALLFGRAREQDGPENAVRKMCDRMQARGPDALGYWSDCAPGVSLGLRRLTILDLDARANQPMVSNDGRYVIVFNGEIYNLRDGVRHFVHVGYWPLGRLRLGVTAK